MSDILKQLPNKDVSTEAKELRAAFLHGATCLGKALNKSNGENGNVPLITRDDWLRLCCDWMGTQKCTIENLKLENVVNDALYTILVVIIVKIIFICSFLFQCLLYNHSFKTNLNNITNLSKLFNYTAPASIHVFRWSEYRCKFIKFNE